MSSRPAAAMVVAGVLVALAFMPAVPAVKSPAATSSPSSTPTAGWDGTVTLVGDGSGADTGPQPAQPPVEKLKPGQQPPQFVVFSWDAAMEDDSHLLSQLRTAPRRTTPG